MESFLSFLFYGIFLILLVLVIWSSDRILQWIHMALGFLQVGNFYYYFNLKIYLNYLLQLCLIFVCRRHIEFHQFPLCFSIQWNVSFKATSSRFSIFCEYLLYCPFSSQIVFSFLFILENLARFCQVSLCFQNSTLIYSFYHFLTLLFHKFTYWFWLFPLVDSSGDWLTLFFWGYKMYHYFIQWYLSN